MNALSNFDPKTDHYVTGHFHDLPEPGTTHTLLVNGKEKKELVMGSWWLDEPIRDPYIGNRRHAALITRTIEG